VANVFSTRLFRARGYSGAPSVQFAVPAGFVAVVKAISIVHGVQATTGEAWVEDDEAGQLVAVTTPAGSHREVFTWFGEWVFLPAETLSPATDSVATACDFHVAGFLLTLP
jgi:hypothetical protein